MCLVVALTLNLFTPLVYADNVTSDSIGSINREDDGVSIGVDETQSEKTIYNNETDSPINESGEQETLVYVSQASTFFVKIPKTIILGGKLNESGVNSGTYEVSVGGNIGGEETIDVVPEKTFALKQLGKNDIKAYVSQDKESWTFDEVDVIANGVVSTNDMSAGTWNGSFVFNIELLQKTKIGVEAFDSNSENLNATATLISGIKREQLLDALEEQGLATKDEVDELIEVNSNEFDTIATTTFDVSNIAKQGEKVTILHFDEEKGEWEFIATKVVDENGEITADFTSYSPVAFVKVEENGNIHRHEFVKTILKETTCTINGEFQYICKCGENYIETTTAMGHQYIDEVCVVCKTKNPNYEEPGYYENNELVWTWEELLENTELELINNNELTSGELSNSRTNLKKLTGKIVIHNDILKISNYTFYLCSNLETIKLGEKTTFIGQRAFNGCASLKTIDIPNSVNEVGGYAFWETIWLEEKQSKNPLVVVGNGVLIDGRTAFGKVELSNEIKFISKGAFKDNKNIESIIIPSSITKLCDATFYGCSTLKNIELPNTIIEIGAHSFWNCSSLTEITIPDKITRIEESLFNGCSKLETIVLPNTITYIGPWAFFNCINLQNITISKQLVEIEESAFNNTAITKITLPSSLKHIGLYAFRYCSKLTYVEFEDKNGWYITKTTNATSGTNLTLTDTSKNATYLKSTYAVGYHFYKNN